MIKALFKYLLLLGIFFLSGHSHLFAHNFKESSVHALVKDLRGTERANLLHVHYEQAFIVNSSSSDTREFFLIETTDIEEEENESNSLRKYLEASVFFTGGIHALISGYFFQYLRKNFSFHKHFVAPSLMIA